MSLGALFLWGVMREYEDEKPIHRVQVPAFYLGKYEVTQAQWRKVMGSNPSYNKNCDDCPVENVSWEEVKDFIRKLNAQSRYTYRLPYEAEWEFAAKGGSVQQSYMYAGSHTPDEVGWYYKNSGGKTQPVGRLAPNRLGIYDLSGNVWEWCEDYWHNSYKGAPTNGAPWVSPPSDSRVLRGGSWGSYADYLRVSNRNDFGPSLRDYYVGFRLARTP